MKKNKKKENYSPWASPLIHASKHWIRNIHTQTSKTSSKPLKEVATQNTSKHKHWESSPLWNLSPQTKMLSGACGLRACCLRLPYSPERPLLRAASLRLRRCRRVLSTACSVSASGAKKEKVIVISGPTGAGKSRLAIELAKRLNGEIISADSVQVWKDFFFFYYF